MGSNNLSRLSSRINIMDPFKKSRGNKQSKLSENFERLFLSKMTKKNKNKIFTSLVILMVQSVVHLMIILLDIENDGISWSGSIIEIIDILTIILYFSFSRTSSFISYPFLPKLALAGMFIVRFFSNVFQIWTFTEVEKK